MGTFFSGTDESQLNDRALVSNYFLMLIVNFKGDFIARVAWRAKVKQTIRTILSDKTVEFYHNEDGFNPLTFKMKDVDKDKEENNEREVLCVMECNVVKEPREGRQPNPFQARYEKVVDACKKASISKPYYATGGHGGAYQGQRAAGYGHPGQQQLPSREWEQPRTRKEEKQQRKAQKRIAEMTDAEFIESQKEQTQKDYEFDYRDTNSFLNAICSYGAIENARADSSDPISTVTTLWREATSRYKDEFQETFIEEMEKWLDANFPKATNDEKLAFAVNLEKFCKVQNYYEAFAKIEKIVGTYVDFWIDKGLNDANKATAEEEKEVEIGGPGGYKGNIY